MIFPVLQRGPVSVHGSLLVNPLQPWRLREELILSVDGSGSTTVGEVAAVEVLNEEHYLRHKATSLTRQGTAQVAP